MLSTIKFQMTLHAQQVLFCFPFGGEPLHGMEIVGKCGLSSGTAYPILHRLEQAGILTARWEVGDPSDLGRPRRRYYSLTRKGRTVQQAEAKAVEQMMRRAGNVA